MRTNLSTVVAAACIAGLAFVARTAHAHISMVGDYQSRGGDEKEVPCDGSTRGSGSIYTFEPGETITIGVSEYVPHPSYFRVSFDADGTDGFKEPVSIFPIDQSRGNQGATDKDKASDFCSNETVLMDNIDPHLAGLFDTWMWQVKLPDIECDNCTIQVIQVMQDPLGHGPFDGDNDMYHRCIDVVLKAKDGSTPSGEFPACTIGERVMGQLDEKTGTPGQDAGATRDAGTTSDGGPRPQDASAGSTQDSGGEQGGDDDDEPAPGADAGALDAGVKKDAGTAKDAGAKRDASATSDDENDDDDDDADDATSGDDGCSVMGPADPSSAAWFLVVVGGLVARVRRGRRRNA